MRQRRDPDTTQTRTRWTTNRGPNELQLQFPSWLTSLVLHAAALVILAIATFPLPALPELALQAALVEDESIEIDPQLFDLDVVLKPESLDESVDQEIEIQLQVDPRAVSLDAASVSPSELEAEVIDFGAVTGDLGAISTPEGMSTSGLAGRGAASKAGLLVRGGGTRSSEKAVLRALDWLAQHQYPDGSWNFDHSQTECDGRCGNPGTLVEARAGATGLVLLAYLGAGYTHEEGRYKAQVYKGIYALGGLIKMDENGGSFWDPQGRMYSHGIATMAICEAYALTEDPALREPAQAAINYICYAQDPRGGGWRYNPREVGDTSVVGWQIGALKSGYLSNLGVPPAAVHLAKDFLDTMMVDQGSGYIYYLDPLNKSAAGPAVTAIGLLCQMFLGASRDDPGLERGVDFLSKLGPSSTDVYFNYYAAQTLFHYTGGKGDVWTKWNEKMREMLVATQLMEGHEVGSWTPAESGGHGNLEGGRLYTTAMSTMTLEVYYRMLPIYRPDAVAGEFEFDK